MSVALVIVVVTALLAIGLVLFIIFIGVREPRAERKQREAGARVRAGEAAVSDAASSDAPKPHERS
jgi:hypothetical protein